MHPDGYVLPRVRGPVRVDAGRLRRLVRQVRAWGTSRLSIHLGLPGR